MGDLRVWHGEPLMPAEQILKKLHEPFPAELIEEKPGGGGRSFSYVPGWAVEERLDQATGGVWSYEILWTEWDRIIVKRNQADVERDACYTFVRLTIPGLGSRCGRGVQVKEPGGGEDVIKGAETDAIKVAASKFGVARDLYRGGGAVATGSHSGGNSYSGQNQSWSGQNQQQAPRQSGPPTGTNAVTEAQWGKFNKMTQMLGIDPNAVIKQATNGFDMQTVNKRGMTMTIDLLTKIESGEIQWSGAAKEPSDMDNSGRSDGRPYSPPPQPKGNLGFPTKEELLVKIRNTNTGAGLDAIYDELVAMMIQDDPDLMNALSTQAQKVQ